MEGLNGELNSLTVRLKMAKTEDPEQENTTLKEKLPDIIRENE